jgi:hypothetical protein
MHFSLTEEKGNGRKCYHTRSAVRWTPPRRPQALSDCQLDLMLLSWVPFLTRFTTEHHQEEPMGQIPLRLTPPFIPFHVPVLNLEKSAEKNQDTDLRSMVEVVSLFILKFFSF